MTVKDTVKDTADRATAFASDTLANAGDKLHDATSQLRDSAGAAKASAGETLSAAREKAAEALDVAKEKSSAAYASARETAVTVRTKTAGGIEQSPIGALIGGIAIGALLGALLPRSEREAEVLAPLGDKLGTLAKNAFAAAKEAGQDTLDELGVNKDAAREQVDRLIDTASKAATSATSAAAGAIRSPQS